MKQPTSANQRQHKKRLKKIAKSKARRAELNKKHKKRAECIAKEVEALRKKREKEFFQTLKQRKQLKKRLQDSNLQDDKIVNEKALVDNGVTENSQDIENHEVAMAINLNKVPERLTDEVKTDTLSKNIDLEVAKCLSTVKKDESSICYDEIIKETEVRQCFD